MFCAFTQTTIKITSVDMPVVYFSPVEKIISLVDRVIFKLVLHKYLTTCSIKNCLNGSDGDVENCRHFFKWSNKEICNCFEINIFLIVKIVPIDKLNLRVVSVVQFFYIFII